MVHASIGRIAVGIALVVLLTGQQSGCGVSDTSRLVQRKPDPTAGLAVNSIFGRWAGDNKSCDLVGNAAYEGYRVISVHQIAGAEETCNVTSISYNVPRWTVSASCAADGNAVIKSYVLESVGPNELLETFPDEPIRRSPYVRCAEPAPNPNDAGITADNPEARLGDPLQSDTLDALQAGRSRFTPPYVGVWAGDAASCAQIDTSTYDGFFVITPRKLRGFEYSCAVSKILPKGNQFEISGRCSAEGSSYRQTFKIEMENASSLTWHAERNQKATYVRCWKPRS